MKKVLRLLLVVGCFILFCTTASAAEKTETKKPVSNKVSYEMLNNVYLDALEYSGYDVQKQIENNTIFENYAGNVESGILSDISYGWVNSDDGQCTKHDKEGNVIPDISKMERTNLCCASYVSYVVFNYLPNVANLKTSEYAKPEVGTWVPSWRVALKQWVADGLSEVFYPTSRNFDWDNIPIGSILIFGSNDHIALYAGEYNGTHFVTHVGNERGPEINTVEGLSASACGKLSAVYVPDYTKSRSIIRLEERLILNGVASVSGGVYQIRNLETNKVRYVNTQKGVRSIYVNKGKYEVKLITAPDGYLLAKQYKIGEKIVHQDEVKKVSISKNYTIDKSVAFYFVEKPEVTISDELFLKFGITTS